MCVEQRVGMLLVMSRMQSCCLRNTDLINISEHSPRRTSCTSPLTAGTKKMFNDAAFAKMKKGARIMNVARGGVIDDDALARALDAGIVASAALDVFEEEPPKFEGHPLIGRCETSASPQLKQQFHSAYWCTAGVEERVMYMLGCGVSATTIVLSSLKDCLRHR
jgi:hypothetical protein